MIKGRQFYRGKPVSSAIIQTVKHQYNYIFKFTKY